MRTYFALPTTGYHTLTSQCCIYSDTPWQQCKTLLVACNACSAVIVRWLHSCQPFQISWNFSDFNIESRFSDFHCFFPLCEKFTPKKRKNREKSHTVEFMFQVFQTRRAYCLGACIEHPSLWWQEKCQDVSISKRWKKQPSPPPPKKKKEKILKSFFFFNTIFFVCHESRHRHYHAFCKVC